MRCWCQSYCLWSLYRKTRWQTRQIIDDIIVSATRTEIETDEAPANPSEVKAGDYFRFKLLYQGKPIAEYINATYVGFSTENAWAYSTRTDNRGVGDIKILTAGIWVIKANLKAPYPDSEEADEYSYTTSLTFEVR